MRRIVVKSRFCFVRISNDIAMLPFLFNILQQRLDLLANTGGLQVVVGGEKGLVSNQESQGDSNDVGVEGKELDASDEAEDEAWHGKEEESAFEGVLLKGGGQQGYNHGRYGKSEHGLLMPEQGKTARKEKSDSAAREGDLDRVSKDLEDLLVKPEEFGWSRGGKRHEA